MLPIHSNQYTTSDHPNFENIIVINRSVMNSTNIEIIRRTETDLKLLKSVNIFPSVCISLSEIMKDPLEEAKFSKPVSSLNEWLKNIMVAEVLFLENILKEYNHVITTGWTCTTTNIKRPIDFIDIANEEVYCVSSYIYEWLKQHQHILKFTDKSFDLAVENCKEWEKKLKNNQFIKHSSTGYHLRLNSKQPYNCWLDYIIEKLNLIDLQNK